MAMNPEIKARWVAALRSGEYKQGKGQLRTPSGEFCCLGVLCDLHGKETGADSWSTVESVCLYEGNEGVPSRAVTQWAGLDTDNPEVLIAGAAEPVAVHNDGRGVGPWGAIEPRTFAEIAQAIEEQL